MTRLERQSSARTRILIVEDDCGFAELMASILEEGGFSCCCASSGKEALIWLVAQSPKLVILDYSLPDMTGASLIERMRELGGNTPFIVVTGKDDASLAVEMMKTGACDYLLKDTSFLDRLLAVVVRALQEVETRERLDRAKHSLRLSEARLARAQKIARLGSWEWDVRAGEIYWSDELYRIFGFTPGEPKRISKEWIYSLIHPADLPAFKQQLLTSVKTLQSFNMIYHTTSRSGGELVVNIQGEVERGEDGRAWLISGTVLDITARIKAESEIHHLINYDTLTGLPNRSLLHDRLRQAIAQAAQDRHMVWVLCLDLDRFKGVNDTLGHRSGDKLLQEVARRLAACVRESDTLARLGGDEFVVVLDGVVSEKGASIVAKKILTLIAEPIPIDDHELYTTASIGIAAYPMDGEDGHTLLKHADLAMYKAKELDRNNFHFFSHDMNIKVMERMMLENSMRKALERDEFFLVYQPQVDARSGRITGVEALLRWNHPDMGLLTPDRFIYLAEETGFIVPLGEWVLMTACRQNRAWQKLGFPPLRVAVNLSGKQFGQHRLDEMISAILLETGLEPEWLELEITESAIMRNADQNIAILRSLKEKGISLAIDDFGTGYSSLSYLKHFPITRLKIDKTFVQDITTNPDDAAIAEIIIAMAQTLKLNVIAEGVETRAQMEFLSTHTCFEMQGYLFSRPLTTDKFVYLLRDGISY
ncbi:EAL domain-containing protein [Pelobacter propionicus]|uniref:Response regulator receiver modulated diguanylate cyclase/phosphodiesterase n=1 Tax=Pelobacter propionicus (strain DSM 2379 / NBRC 103807 / OttBd1) TaxID=338966 RepID=A1ALB3_PELPD|nr:EAL domain-containing protein [Pelobacter propionicus]ABK98133.1 response regulator receiver modulated diguanylate cyclase/phosphodiesterase [Pelobacter propionicus DSM 2379]